MEIEKGQMTDSQIIESFSENHRLFDNKLVRKDVLGDTFEMVNNCIEFLDDEALKELEGGYNKDIDLLVNDLVKESIDVLLLGKREKSDSTLTMLERINNSVEETYRRDSMLYFIDAIFGNEVILNWHHFEWAEIIHNHPLSVILASRDTGKSFFYSLLYPAWMLYRYVPNHPKYKMCEKGFMFSNNDDKAKFFLGGLKEIIEDNSVLREKLFNKKREKWKSQSIECLNGAKIENAKGFLGAARGYHPQWIVIDDPLLDQTMYSPTYREKCIDYFYSVIVRMLVPNGQLRVIGTPFHEKDLYNTFRTKLKLDRWIYREYPIIFPNGQLLWEGRYDLDKIKEARMDSGNVIFSREMLCRPLSSESSLFPWKILRNAIEGMEKYVMVNNREAFPIKFDYIVSGHDFATSANVGADATVYTVWGIDQQGCYWLLYMWRKVGASFNEQVAKINEVYENFRPDIMTLENNNFQSLYSQHFENTALPIYPHTTGKQKNDLKYGVPSLSIMFESGKFRIPYGDEISKRKADILLSEFNSIGYTEKGVQSVGGHDDCVPKGTLIRVKGGVKPIEEVEVGDMVLTHKGRYRRVYRKGNRYAEYVHKVKSYGKIDLTITDNHELFLFDKKTNPKRRNKVRYINPEWIPINSGIDITTKGVAYPINNDVINVDSIDLMDYANESYKDENGKLVSYTYNGKRKNPKANEVDRYLKLDEDLCYLLGYYLAKGSCGKHNVSFSSNVKEVNIQKRVEDTLLKYGFKPNYIIRKNTKVISVGSVILKKLFSQMGKSKEKKPLSFMWNLPKEKQAAILEGYFMGDGDFSNDGIVSLTISSQIAFFIYECCLRLGYRPNIKSKNYKAYNSSELSKAYTIKLNKSDSYDFMKNLKKSFVNEKTSHWLSKPQKEGSVSIKEENYLIGRVYSENKEYFDDKVYNIAVEEDNSYVANGVIVHNCAFSTYMARNGYLMKNEVGTFNYDFM